MPAITYEPKAKPARTDSNTGLPTTTRAETTEIEWAWFAGVVDGEGCVTITRQRPGSGGRRNYSYRLYVKVAMCHEPTIRRLRDLAGLGAVTLSTPGQYLPSWCWWAANRQGIAVLERIRPYLITKAEETDIALEWGHLPLAPLGGRGGGQFVPTELLGARRVLFERLRDAKLTTRARLERERSITEEAIALIDRHGHELEHLL